MPNNGGYDKPYYAGATRYGSNKEITDEWTLRAQAEKALAEARTSAKGKLKPGNYKTEKVTRGHLY